MPISIISISADEQLQETLEYVSQALCFGTVTAIDRYISPTDTVQINAGSDSSPVVVISLDVDREAGLVTADILSKMQNPKFRVIVASSSQDVNLILGIIKEGKYEFLPLPTTTAQVMAAFKRAVPAGMSLENVQDTGKVYLFAGTSGGAGTTTIATHVAVALASEGKKTLLVDYHRSLGHAALYLNLQNNGRSLFDLIANEARLDESLLGSYIVQHSTGLDVLCSSENIVGAGDETHGAFKKILAFLRLQYGYIVFDLKAGDPDMAILVPEAERVFFVTSAEVAAMRDLHRYAEFYGKGDPKFEVVVNHEGRSAVTAAHIEGHTGLVIAAKFAEVSGRISDATNQGNTVDLEVRSFHESLGVMLNAIDPQPVQEEPKKSWFSWGKKR
jgi:pilus assembly protein CpaE